MLLLALISGPPIYKHFNRKQFSLKRRVCITLVLLYLKGEGLQTLK